VSEKNNVADFFTKALPVARHRTFLAPFFAVDPEDTMLNNTLSFSTLNVLSFIYDAC
jgi:hypothetical protein